MEFLVIGIAVAFNCIIIKEKLERGRYEDGIFDLLLLILLTIVFSGTYGSLVVGTIASAFISLYFMKSPPTFFNKIPYDKIKAKLNKKSSNRFRNL